MKFQSFFGHEKQSIVSINQIRPFWFITISRNWTYIVYLWVTFYMSPSLLSLFFQNSMKKPEEATIGLAVYHRVGSQQSFRRHRQLNNCTLSIVNFSNCFFFPLLLNLFLFIIIIFFPCDWLCVESCFYCFGFSARFFSVGQTKFSLSFFKLHILSVVILKFWC